MQVPRMASLGGGKWRDVMGASNQAPAATSIRSVSVEVTMSQKVRTSWKSIAIALTLVLVIVLIGVALVMADVVTLTESLL
jgi:hypothetical protein